MMWLVEQARRDGLQHDLLTACDVLESIMRDHHTPPEIARIVADAYNAVIRARQALDATP